jgi:hypothetical protein
MLITQRGIADFVALPQPRGKANSLLPARN